MDIKTKGFTMPNGDTHIFIPPSPTETERGGIKAKTKTTETVEVAVGDDDKLYVPGTDTTLTVENSAADAKATGDVIKELKNETKDISGKLSEPAEGLAVGKYFRVAQIDENGHAVLEAVDLPIASGNQFGVVRVQPVGTGSGVYISSEGFLATQFASASQIDNRTNFNNSITPSNVDYAVKAAMCDGKGAAWTPDEQVAACERIGAEHLGEWEEIVTVTTEEAASSLAVDTDANGNPFSLTHVICEFILPIEDTAKKRHVYFGSDSAIGAATSFSRVPVSSNTTAKAEAIAYAKIISGKIYCDGSIGPAIPNKYQEIQKYGIVNGYCMLSAESFDRIFAITYNDAFPAGSQLIIRGIRK